MEMVPSDALGRRSVYHIVPADVYCYQCAHPCHGEEFYGKD